MKRPADLSRSRGRLHIRRIVNWPSRHISLLRDGLRDLRVAPSSQIPALDALRTAAILMVVAGHFGELGKSQFTSHAHFFDSPIFQFGWTGVDLFFVLSGFLIGGQLWKELKRSDSINVGKFILRRGFRIWPLYFLIVILSPALTGTWSYKWGDWAFLTNYVTGRVEGGWSLSTEEQFYIIAPLALLAGARMLKLRGRVAALIAALAVVAALRWWTARGLLLRGVSVANVKSIMYSPFHLHDEGLTIGLLIALVFITAPAIFERTSPHRKAIWIVAFTAAVSAVVLRAENGIVFPFLSLALIYGSVVAVSLTFRPNELRLLHARPFYTLSRLSYGMYLNHFAVLRWVGPSIARASKAIGGQSAVAIGLSLLAVIGCSAFFAAVTFVLVEHPFLVLRGRMLPSSRDSRSTAAPIPAVAEGAAGYAPAPILEAKPTRLD
jgi:peptidoglycan/LPS O-acetylase OafA/YrhL